MNREIDEPIDNSNFITDICTIFITADNAVYLKLWNVAATKIMQSIRSQKLIEYNR